MAKVGSTPTPGSNGNTQSILDHAFHLKKEGYRKSTIISRLKALILQAAQDSLHSTKVPKSGEGAMDPT